jgi:hypothetical protein
VAWVRFQKLEDHLRSIQNDYGVTQPSIHGVQKDHLPGIKRKGCDADHLTPCSAKVKKCGALSPLSHVSMA